MSERICPACGLSTARLRCPTDGSTTVAASPDEGGPTRRDLHTGDVIPLEDPESLDERPRHAPLPPRPMTAAPPRRGGNAIRWLVTAVVLAALPGFFGAYDDLLSPAPPSPAPAEGEGEKAAAADGASEAAPKPPEPAPGIGEPVAPGIRAVRMATVLLNSDPPGARATMYEREICPATPCAFKIPAGGHAVPIEVHKDGYATEKVHFLAGAGAEVEQIVRLYKRGDKRKAQRDEPPPEPARRRLPNEGPPPIKVGNPLHLPE